MGDVSRSLVRLVAALSAVGTLALAGCGSDDGPATTDAGTDTPDTSNGETGDAASSDALAACDLFTEALAEQFLDAAVTVTVDESFSLGEVTESECAYQVADGSTDGYVSASVGVDTATSADGRTTNQGSFTSKRDTSFDIDGDAARVAVAGAGDDAFWDGTNHRVWVLVDDGAYVLQAGAQVGFNSDEDEADVAAKLAELVLDEL